MDITTPLGENSANVYRVEAHAIDFVWPRCVQLMTDYDGGVFRFTELTTVYQMLKEDKIELWIGLHNKEIKLAALTQLCGDKEKYVELFWTGGTDFNLFYSIGLNKIQQWAGLMGAKNMVIGGRVGWSKKLQKYGFDFHRIELIKRLDFIQTDVTGQISWRN